jgi:hypothetical protein
VVVKQDPEPFQVLNTRNRTKNTRPHANIALKIARRLKRNRPLVVDAVEPGSTGTSDMLALLSWEPPQSLIFACPQGRA